MNATTSTFFKLLCILSFLHTERTLVLFTILLPQVIAEEAHQNSSRYLHIKIIFPVKNDTVKRSDKESQLRHKQNSFLYEMKRIMTFWGPMPSCVPGLLLILHSGITPDRIWRNTYISVFKPGSAV